MFKIRIDVKGFHKYNGLLGTVEFEDGVSVREVTEEELNRLGAIMKMVRLDTDEQVGGTTKMVRNKNVEATSAPSYTPKPEPKVEEVAEETAKEETPKEAKYTKEALEKIADDEGIKGVRKVADTYGVKGVQISALIDGILEEQSKED